MVSLGIFNFKGSENKDPQEVINYKQTKKLSRIALHSLKNVVSLVIFKFKGSENKDLPGGDKLQKNE